MAQGHPEGASGGEHQPLTGIPAGKPQAIDQKSNRNLSSVAECGDLGKIGFKIAQMALQDRFQNRTLELLIAMDCNVAKTDHVFHGTCGCLGEQPMLHQQFERLPAMLGNP